MGCGLVVSFINLFTLIMISTLHKQFSARAAALLLMTSLLISAFPASFFVANAATQLGGSAGPILVEANVTEYVGLVDTTDNENITLSFDYDLTGQGDSADGLESNDSLRYGYRIGAASTEVGFVNGEAGLGAGEIGSVNNLPLNVATSDIPNLEIYFSVNSAGGTDNAYISNVVVSGDEIVASVPVCDTTDNVGNTTFDTFSLGDVDGQNAWKSTGPFDQEIVENTYGYTDFGCQSLRISNSVTSSSFGDHTFAAPFADSVGEVDATAGTFAVGTRYTHYEAEFDIASTKPTQEQTGMFLSVSPDRGDGSRMSYLSFADNATGIAVTFFDTQGTTNPANFVSTDLGTLSRDVPHTIKFVIDTVDGPDNDVAEIYIDGALAHTGSTWENYYRFDNEASAEQSPRLLKTLLFRASGTAVPTNAGEGYLIDNLSLEASVLPPPKPSETVEVTGNTYDLGTGKGWLFNRDLANATPIAFNEDESVIGDGALYVLPISNTDAPRKFIGEYFWLGNISELEAFSYDFKIGAGGADTDSEEFYLNVYANFAATSPTNYYDCKYDVVPSNGTTAGFATVTFDPTQDYPVTTSGGSPHTCPASPADMDNEGAGSVIRAFAINTGDTSLNDADLDGYFDKVVLDTTAKVTTFDFESPGVDPNDQNQLTITVIKFHNRNSDNNRDAGEEGLTGWEMRLYKEMPSSWSLVATGTTDVTGQKKFPQQKEAGTYFVCEVNQLGWTQVAPAEDTQTVNTSPNVGEEGAYCTRTVYTDVADRSTKPEIGNVSNDLNNENQFNFSGLKFENKNGDRDRDIGEDVLAGWKFNFYKEVAGDWTFIASSTTGADGVYKFPTQYDAGIYHVCEENQIGWDQVRQDWSGTPYHIVTDNLSPNASIEGPYCATATYTDESDRSKKSYFGNMKEPEVVDYSTVTMCKYDEQDNPLAGWQLALVGEQVLKLAFAPTADTQTMSAVPAGDYVLKAEGSYNYGNGNRFADARFSERKPGEANYVGPYLPWVVASPVHGGLAVQVDGDLGALWGDVFSPSHVYYGSVSKATTGDIQFTMYDDGYSDNSGSIDLTLSKGFTGVTEANGCITFTDVPYGSYEVEELLQGGFENTSGLTEVEVDEDTETFTVVNNDLSFVPPCEVEAYSDAGTVVIENNAYATSTYVHKNWTASIPGADWIWEAYQVIDPTVTTIKTFEETFTAVDPNTATLDVAADNGYRVFVNDELVADRTGNANNFQTHTQKTFTSEILDELVSGENTLRIEVTNSGVPNSNYLQNPAGLLFKLVVNGASDCAVTTETEPIPDTLVITNPAADNDVVPRTLFSFEAEYTDNDTTVDNIQWAIRAGTCSAGVGTIAGNVDGFNNTSTFSGINFSAQLDTTTWDAGNYCFIVNPSEQTGEPNLRESRLFIIEPIVDTDPAPVAMYEISGFKYEVTGSATSTVSDWTITATNGTTSTTTVTAVDGSYSFMLPEGSWTVSEEMQLGWDQSSVNQNGVFLADGPGLEECNISLSSGRSSSNTCDFYNEQEVIASTPSSSSRSSSSGTQTSRFATPTPEGLVLGASTSTTTTMCPFLDEYQKIGTDNTWFEVMKLQLFLSIVMGYDNPATGVFDAVTFENVKAFQLRYSDEVLDPWFDAGITADNNPTGYVFKTTKWKINDIICPGHEAFPTLTE